MSADFVTFLDDETGVAVGLNLDHIRSKSYDPNTKMYQSPQGTYHRLDDPNVKDGWKIVTGPGLTLNYDRFRRFFGFDMAYTIEHYLRQRETVRIQSKKDKESEVNE